MKPGLFAGKVDRQWLRFTRKVNEALDVGEEIIQECVNEHGYSRSDKEGLEEALSYLEMSMEELGMLLPLKDESAELGR